MNKATNPANTKPPTSIDQSPVSKPRRRPSVVKRSVARRNIVATFWFADDGTLACQTKAWLLHAGNGRQQSAINVNRMSLSFQG